MCSSDLQDSAPQGLVVARSDRLSACAMAFLRGLSGGPRDVDAPGRRFMPKDWPLILVSGMGADHRLLCHQVAAFPNAIVLPWLDPEPRETLASYARRLARANDPGGPCFVGGVSLGGMIAQEMTRHLDARACFLISTIRSARQLPLRVRTLSPLRPVLSDVFF